MWRMRIRLSSPGRSLSKIYELKRSRKFARAHGGDNCLQLILAFGGDTHLTALNLSRGLELFIANERRELFGDRLFEPLFYRDELASVAERRNVRLSKFDTFQADASLGEFAHYNFRQSANLELIFCRELDFVF